MSTEKMKISFKIHICLGLFLMLTHQAAAQVVPKQINEGWGYFDSQTGQILAEGFEKAGPFIAGLSIARKAGSWGAIDEKLQTIIPFDHDRVQYLAGETYASWQAGKVRLWRHALSKASFLDAGLLRNSKDLLVLKDQKGQYGIVDIAGKEIFPFQFSHPPLELDNFLLFHQRKGKQIHVGLYQRDGQNIISPRYYSIESYADKYYRTMDQTGKSLLFDRKGELLYNGEKGEIDWILDDFLVLKKEDGEQRTVIVRSTQAAVVLTSPEFRDGLMIGKDSDGLSVLLMSNGKIIRLKNGQTIRRIERGKILICKLNEADECIGGKLIDLAGNVLVPPIFSEITSWNDRWAVIQLKKNPGAYALYQWGEKPHILLENQRQITLYDHNFVMVVREGVREFLNPQLEKSTFSRSNLPVQRPFYLALRGYEINRIRSTSEIFDPDSLKRISYSQIVPIETNDVKNIKDNYSNNPLPNRLLVRASYRMKGPRIFITDLYGKVISPLFFTSASHYENGLIHVYGKDTIDNYPKVVHGLMDFDGKIQIPLVYDKIHKVDSSFIIAEKHGLQGLISWENEVILPFKYIGINHLASGHLLIKRFNKWGIARSNGEVICEPIYDKIQPVLPIGSGFEASLKGKVVYLNADGKE